MGARGPAPKPTELRVLHGDRKDRINTSEPKPADGEVRCPTHLTDGARAVWERLAPDLIAKKVLTPWDVDDFATFCDAADRFRQAQQGLDAGGMVVDEPIVSKSSGEVVGYRQATSKWWQVWKGSSEVMLRYGARFGLSPSDRSQLSIKGDRDDAKGAARLLS